MKEHEQHARIAASILESGSEDWAHDEKPFADQLIDAEQPAGEMLATTSTTMAGSATGKATSGLGKQAARGASITLVGQLTKILIQIGSVAVLARLVDPVDYGLVAIVLAIVSFGEILRDSGLSTAAVQSRELTSRQRDQLFWLNGAIGFGLTLVVVLSAHVVAAIFHQSELIGITQALAFTFTLNGFTAQYRAHLNRHLRFSALVMADLCALVIGIAIALVIALSGAGYWALVVQQLATALATLMIMISLSGWLPGRPRRGVDISSITRFGHGLMASQVVAYLNNNVDTFTIALTLGPGPLGIYNRAFQLLMRPLGQLRAPTTTVALPVLSRLHDDPDRLGRYVVRGQIALGYTLIAIMAFAAGAAVPLVDLLLGPKWSQTPPIFAVLAVAGSFQTLAYVGNWVYLAKAFTAQLFYYSTLSLVVKIICVLIGSHWGLLGVAAGFTAAPALMWPVSLWWLSRLTPLPLRSLCVGGFRISALAAVAACACFVVTSLLSADPSLIQAIAGFAVFVMVYAVAATVLPPVRSDANDVLQIARKALNR